MNTVHGVKKTTIPNQHDDKVDMLIFNVFLCIIQKQIGNNQLESTYQE